MNLNNALGSNSFHALDRVAGAIKAIAAVAAVTYFLVFGNKPEFDSANLLIAVIVMVILGLTLDCVLALGVWRHRRWALGLTAGLYALGFLGTVFALVMAQTTDAPIRERPLFTWHDMYGLPIATYCAYRYFTFAVFEAPSLETEE